MKFYNVKRPAKVTAKAGAFDYQHLTDMWHLWFDRRTKIPRQQLKAGGALLTNIGKCWGIWMFLLTIYCKWLHSSLTYPILSSLKLCYIRYIHAALYGIKNMLVVLVQLYFPLPIQSRRREKFSRRRRIFSSCIGSISSFFQNLITTSSKEAADITG